MAYETLLFEVSDGLAKISLNRPDAANSLNGVMAHDLMMAAIRCDEDPDIRAVLLTGTGKMFCAGGDLKTFHGAAESAMFTSAYTAAGLSPDGSSTYFMPRLSGLRRSQELMLTNRRLSADEAVEWGLINRVVSDEKLMEEAESLARDMASGATGAYGAVKKMLTETFTNPLETQMELEARYISERATSPDGREGVDAFVKKRKPNFKGE